MEILNVPLSKVDVDQANIQVIKLHPEVLAFLIAEFLAVKINKSSQKGTYNNYAGTLKEFGEFTMGDLSDQRLLRFKLERIDLDKSGAPRAIKTANRILYTVRMFMHYLQGKYVIARNYFDFVDSRPASHVESPYIALQDHEVHRMINHPDQNTLLGINQRVAMVLFFYLGLRRVEVCNLTLGDVQEGVLRVLGKGNKVRYLPISGVIQDEINALLSYMATTLPAPSLKHHLIQSRESHGHMVNPATVWRWFTGTASACGIVDQKLIESGKKYSPHTARATAITKSLDNGADLREVSAMAGHNHIETTSLYDKRRGEAAKRAAGKISY